MAEASKTDLFGDLSYGDETRRNGDYVGLPHDQDESNASSTSANNVLVGQAVRVDAQGNIAKADGTGDAVGVLSNYERSGDSGGPSDPAPIDQDQDANVKVGGTVKAEVESDVSAGEYLTPGNTTNGVFDNNSADSESRFLALTGAVEDDRPDGTTAHYAEVLIQ